MFPVVATLITRFFLDRVAAAVEALDYPGQGRPRDQPWGGIIAVKLRLSGMTKISICYVLAPGINFFLFLGLNGYLFRRESFRGGDIETPRSGDGEAMRHAFAGRVFAARDRRPVRATAVDLLAPVIATAFMVHVFESIAT